MVASLFTTCWHNAAGPVTSALYLGSEVRRLIIGILLILSPLLAFGSLPLEVSMLKVVEASDHVLTVKVVDVDMVDENGNQVSDLDAETGPGLTNVIRLKSVVMQVHLTTADNVPKVLYIPLDNNMHYSLGQVLIAHRGRPYNEIVVLKGKEFTPAYSGIFRYPEYELETILTLFKYKNGKI